MASSSVDIVDLAEQLESLVDDAHIIFSSSTDGARHRLGEVARKLSLALESQVDTIHRIALSPLQLPMACIGVETKLFEILAGTNGTATHVELAERTTIDPVLLKRLLRYYQSFGFISQLGDDAYGANNITKAMTSPAGRIAPPFHLSVHTPAINALPQFLRENGYANITDPNHCAWQMGHHTDDPLFPWFQKHPQQMELFLSWMQNNRHGLPIFLDTMDIEQELARGSTDSTILFVDIGGAMGHQCIAVKQRYPKLRGRIILQDQPGVIEQINISPLPGFEGIEAEAYDFFTPQPLKGARAYYLRNVLHDWPDHMCVEILRNIKAGMTEESKILIDEMVLPERAASWKASQYDVTMSCAAGAAERSYSDWVRLLNEAGLRILKIWEFTHHNDSIIMAIPK